MKPDMNLLKILFPVFFLAAVMLISYLNMPIPWFLVVTGLLLLYEITERERTSKTEVIKISGSEEARAGAGVSQEIIEHMPDALMVYDENFRMKIFNPAAEKLFGIKREAVLNKAIEPKDAETAEWKRLVQVLFPSLAPTMVNRSEPGGPQVVDLSFEAPEAEYSTITAPMGDGTFIKIIRDRTKEVSMMKEKSEFITVASHQLRTPISSLIWSLEELGKIELNAEARQMADNALNSARKLGTLVEDLLNTSKIEEGKFAYEFEEADIVDFLGHIMDSALPQARRLGIQLYFDKPQEELPPVSIDPKKLSMAFLNLLDNAIRYNVQNGEVAVRVRKLPDRPYVEVAVRDTGIGMSKEDLENIFKKFYRGESALKFETQGSGLGLYIVKSIIESHGGEVRAESEPQSGSAFYFTLPVSQNRAVPDQNAPFRI